MDESRCRICNNPCLDCVLEYDKSPRFIERLLDEASLKTDHPVRLKVYQCQDCGHVQLVDQLQDDYYEDYLMTHSNIQKMRDFQQEQITNFVDFFNLESAQVFEVGAGDGQYSMILKDMGFTVTANEPSARAKAICENKGLITIGGYVSQGEMTDLSGTFDAIIARQVLEHVPDPNDFMLGVRELLKPDGVGLIEVPALEQAIENQRFFDFFPDHLSYFSCQALHHLFARNMFKVIRIQRAMDGEYNEAWIQRVDKPSFSVLQNAANNISDAFQKFLKNQLNQVCRVAVWGAGAKGVLTLSMVDVSSIAYLIDSDPVKQHRFTPVSHLEVSSPQRLMEDPVDTILITALAYKDEIIQDLRHKYNFKGQIAYISGGNIILEMEK